MRMVILYPSLFMTLMTVTSNTKFDERKENVYSINMLSISVATYLRGSGSTSPRKAIDSVNVACLVMDELLQPHESFG